MRVWSTLLGILLFCILWFLGWQTWAVVKARTNLDAIFAEVPISLRWDDLTARQQDIFLRVEDPSFFEHNGMDLDTPGAGITTITQALAKRLFFEKFTPGIMKIEQTLVAVLAIDPKVSKEDQLTAFLNVAYFGTFNGTDVIGFEAGAQHHFGRPVAALSEGEYMGLVAMLIGPNRFARGTNDYFERLDRVRNLIAGRCIPDGNGDPWLEGCA